MAAPKTLAYISRNRRDARHNLRAQIVLKGDPCLFAAVCANRAGTPDDAYRTLLMQEMIARGALFQGLFYPTWSHQRA